MTCSFVFIGESLGLGPVGLSCLTISKSVDMSIAGEKKEVYSLDIFVQGYPDVIFEVIFF